MTPPPQTPRLERLWPAALAVFAFAAFASTACRTFFAGDSAELSAAAAVFGVPHPPGYPLYTLVTGLGVRVLGFLDPAHASNCMSALYAAVLLWVTCRVLQELGTPKLGLTTAALVLVGGRTFWSQSTVAEVYTFDLLLLALVVFSARHLKPSAPTAVLFGTALGSWIVHRPVNLIYLPSIAIALGPAVGRRVGGGGGDPPAARRRVLLGVAGGLALAPLVFAYLPVASMRNPPIDIGDPQTLERFLVVIQGAPYRRHLFGGDLGLALQRLSEFFLQLPREVGLGVVLAPIGLIALWRRARLPALAVAVALVTNLAYSAAYNILDIEPYWLPAYLLIAALSGFAVHALVRSRVQRLATGTALALSFALTVGANLSHVDLREHRITRTFAEDLLASVDDRAVLVANGDTTVHALWYLQAVELLAPDVIVLSPGHLHEWYADQLRARYPSEPWPTHSPAEGQLDWARAAVDALSEHRRVYLTLSVDPSPFLRDRNGLRFGTVPRGITMELLRAGGTYNARELAQWNAAYFGERVPKLLPVPRPLDIDSQSTVLQYALALTRNADLQSRLGATEDARRSYEQIVALEPDRMERNVQRDARRAGIEVPLSRFGTQAQLALDVLRRE